MTAFIFVHGTNGSGKTTLARTLITCAGGIVRMETIERGKAKGGIVSHTDAGLLLVGPYRTATGGADSMQPYALVPATVKQLMLEGHDVFAEGLITPGVALCKELWITCTRLGRKSHFILLDTPIEECTTHVLERRARKGNTKPYSNEHLIKKHRSSHNWIVNLRNAGLPAIKRSWRDALDFCLDTYNLSAEHVEWNQ